MMGKKRRKQLDLDASVVHPAKRVKVGDQGSKSRDKNKNEGHLSCTLLLLYYERVVSLRQFLLSKLPSLSKFRRRRLINYGLDEQASQNGIHFLDTTLVGISEETAVAVEEERRRDFLNFTQSQQRSTHSSAGGTQSHGVAEVSTLLSLEPTTLPSPSLSIVRITKLTEPDCRLCHLDSVPQIECVVS